MNHLNKLPDDIIIKIYKIIFQNVLYSINNMIGPYLVINNNKKYLFLPDPINKIYVLFPKRFI